MSNKRNKNTDIENNGVSDEEEYISKTQRKKIMDDLKAMGKTLVELNNKDLAKIPMPEDLADAVNQARKMQSNNAKRRQLQFIGKIIRKIDYEPIEKALDKINQRRNNSTQHFKKLEQLRDHLIAEGQNAIEEVMQTYPGADRQMLRQYVRKAQQELSQEKPPAAARKIFRYLRELDEES